MKIRLIYAMAFVFLLQSAAFAQKAVDLPMAQKDSACSNFSMRIIEQTATKDHLPIVRPNNSVDFKLIIIAPCLPTAQFKSNENDFTLTPKDNRTPNQIVSPKRP